MKLLLILSLYSSLGICNSEIIYLERVLEELKVKNTSLKTKLSLKQKENSSIRDEVSDLETAITNQSSGSQ